MRRRFWGWHFRGGFPILLLRVQVAREVEVAAPVELSKEQRRELVQGFAEREFVTRGMVADIAYHDGDGSNPHAHILLTTRRLEGEGFGGKERDWNRKELLSDWRETWAREANEALERAGIGEANEVLERAGIGERIDHRSLIVQRDEALVRGEIWKAAKSVEGSYRRLTLLLNQEAAGRKRQVDKLEHYGGWLLLITGLGGFFGALFSAGVLRIGNDLLSALQAWWAG